MQACSFLSLKAVYSRTQVSAQRLVQEAAKPLDVYFDTPTLAGRSFNNLIHRQDVQAVIIALPIPVQPDIIKKSIQAGKHVFSEKPIAKDVETASALLRWYGDNGEGQIWNVGENFRFLDSVAFGSHQIGRLGGCVVTFDVTIYGFVDENDEYYQTEW